MEQGGTMRERQPLSTTDARIAREVLGADRVGTPLSSPPSVEPVSDFLLAPQEIRHTDSLAVSPAQRTEGSLAVTAVATSDSGLQTADTFNIFGLSLPRPREIFSRVKHRLFPAKNTAMPSLEGRRAFLKGAAATTAAIATGFVFTKNTSAQEVSKAPEVPLPPEGKTPELQLEEVEEVIIEYATEEYATTAPANETENTESPFASDTPLEALTIEEEESSQADTKQRIAESFGKLSEQQKEELQASLRANKPVPEQSLPKPLPENRRPLEEVRKQVLGEVRDIVPDEKLWAYNITLVGIDDPDNPVVPFLREGAFRYDPLFKRAKSRVSSDPRYPATSVHVVFVNAEKLEKGVKVPPAYQNQLDTSIQMAGMFGGGLHTRWKYEKLPPSYTIRDRETGQVLTGNDANPEAVIIFLPLGGYNRPMSYHDKPTPASLIPDYTPGKNPLFTQYEYGGRKYVRLIYNPFRWWRHEDFHEIGEDEVKTDMLTINSYEEAEKANKAGDNSRYYLGLYTTEGYMLGEGEEQNMAA